MKNVLFMFLSILILVSCNKSPYCKQNGKIYGNWIIVDYSLNGSNIVEQTHFLNLEIELFVYAGPCQHFVERQKTSLTYTNIKKPVSLSFEDGLSKFYFSEYDYIDTNQLIDPLYYKTNLDTLSFGNPIIAGVWNSEFKGRKILILDNLENNNRKNDIKITFEKVK